MQPLQHRRWKQQHRRCSSSSSVLTSPASRSTTSGSSQQLGTGGGNHAGTPSAADAPCCGVSPALRYDSSCSSQTPVALAERPASLCEPTASRTQGRQMIPQEPTARPQVPVRSAPGSKKPPTAHPPFRVSQQSGRPASAPVASTPVLSPRHLLRLYADFAYDDNADHGSQQQQLWPFLQGHPDITSGLTAAADSHMVYPGYGCSNGPSLAEPAAAANSQPSEGAVGASFVAAALRRTTAEASFYSARSHSQSGCGSVESPKSLTPVENNCSPRLSRLSEQGSSIFDGGACGTAVDIAAARAEDLSAAAATAAAAAAADPSGPRRSQGGDVACSQLEPAPSGRLRTATMDSDVPTGLRFEPSAPLPPKQKGDIRLQRAASGWLRTAPMDSEIPNGLRNEEAASASSAAAAAAPQQTSRTKLTASNAAGKTAVKRRAASSVAAQAAPQGEDMHQQRRQPPKLMLQEERVHVEGRRSAKPAATGKRRRTSSVGGGLCPQHARQAMQAAAKLQQRQHHHITRQCQRQTAMDPVDGSDDAVPDEVGSGRLQVRRPSDGGCLFSDAEPTPAAQGPHRPQTSICSCCVGSCDGGSDSYIVSVADCSDRSEQGSGMGTEEGGLVRELQLLLEAQSGDVTALERALSGTEVGDHTSQI